MPSADLQSSKILPLHGRIGFCLIVIFWIVNWTAEGLRTHYGFFFLWLGFILLIDAINCRLRHHSLLTRNRKAFLSLFLFSIPIWWLFEMIDERTRYWYYDGAQYFSCLEYALLASLSFSTVLPAVFECAELVNSLLPGKPVKGPAIGKNQKTAAGFFVLGGIMLILLLLWPRYFPFFLWMSLYFLTEAINVRLGYRTLLDYTRLGNWRPVIVLSLGCLICGVFWELWNYYSYPKWVYTISIYNFWHVFEMPLLGYLGYIPFSFELFAFYSLATGLLNKRGFQNYFSVSS